MGSIFSHGFTKEQLAMALEKVKTTVNSTPVVVFRPINQTGKTYCGYCKRVKQLLSQVGATYKVIELDEDGGETQAALAEWTGQRTVPNVFIAGKHIGGCDSVLEQVCCCRFCERLARLLITLSLPESLSMEAELICSPASRLV